MKSNKVKIFFTLFWTFFKIGLFTFGGGYAMIALIEKEVVEKRKWLSHKEMLDLVAIAESTPGVISLNTATFVGAKMGGFWGSLGASIAVVLPSVIIISAISTVIETFRTNQYVQWAFWGIRSAVAALILNAVYKMFRSVEKSVVSYAVMGVSFALAVLSVLDILPIDIVYIILASALFGVVWGYFKSKKKSKNTPPDSAEKQTEGSPKEEEQK